MTQQQSAMRRAGCVLIATGVFFAIAALPLFHPLVKYFLQIAYWPIYALPPELVLPAPLLVAITGGLTAGLGGMLWALGTHVAGTAPEAAAKVTQMAAWVWFCTDSTASVLVGAPFNAVLNLSFLLLMLVSSKVRASQTTVTL